MWVCIERREEAEQPASRMCQHWKALRDASVRHFSMYVINEANERPPVLSSNRRVTLSLIACLSYVILGRSQTRALRPRRISRLA